MENDDESKLKNKYFAYVKRISWIFMGSGIILLIVILLERVFLFVETTISWHQ